MEKLEQKLAPVNDIYEVPIYLLSASLCSDGSQIRGRRKSSALVEAETPEEARANLMTYPGFINNWRNLALEEMKSIPPFILRDDEITKVRPCERRQRDERGGYVCGELQEDGINGEFGGCVLSGYDAPEELGCPYEIKED